MSNVSEPPHFSSSQVTPGRRRATLAILSVALLAAVLLALPARQEAGADVSTAGALSPVAHATASLPPTPAAESAAPSTTADATTSTTTLDEATTTTTEQTTSTTEAAPVTSAAADPAPAADPTPAPVAPAPTVAPTTTTAPPAPPPPVSSGDPASIIREIFGAHADDALVIATCESSLNPGATNPAGYYGLFQIGTGHAGQFEAVTGTDWSSGRYDARANTTYAKWLFDRSGQTWSQWGCRHRL